MSQVNTLDLRGKPFQQRRELVFAAIESLAPGEAVQIWNDHPPEHLAQVLATRFPGRFEAEITQEGADAWVIHVRRVSSEQ